MRDKFSDYYNLKILTPKQMLRSLPIALGQLKACKTSENLLNEIRQITYSLYWAKKITKTIDLAFIKLEELFPKHFIYFRRAVACSNAQCFHVCILCLHRVRRVVMMHSICILQKKLICLVEIISCCMFWEDLYLCSKLSFFLLSSFKMQAKYSEYTGFKLSLHTS